MFNRLQRDILRQHIGPFLLCFFLILFILLMQFLIEHVDKLVGKGLGFLLIAELIATNLAYMVVLGVPMAILVATLLVFGRFSEWNELTAVRASGVNPFSLMVPVLGASVVLFIFLTYFTNDILPESNQKAQTLMIDIRTKQPDFDLQQGIFYRGISGYTFIAREIPQDSDSLYGVTLYQEEREGREEAIIDAQRGLLVSEDEQTLTLYLDKGTILRYPAGFSRSGEMDLTDFDRFRISFDLSNLAFSRTNPDERERGDRTMRTQAMLAYVDTLETQKEQQIRTFLDRSADYYDIATTPYNQNPTTGPVDPDSLLIYRSGSVQTLNSVIDPAVQEALLDRTSNHFTQYRSTLDELEVELSWRERVIAQYMVEVQKKFSIPFACIIFVLFGAPIGMMTRKGNIGFAAIVSFLVLVFYFTMVIQGEKLADRLIISPFIGMWGINILLGIIGIILTMHVTTPFSLNRWISLERFSNRLQQTGRPKTD